MSARISGTERSSVRRAKAATANVSSANWTSSAPPALTTSVDLVGGDGPDGVPSRIEPTLQKAPGEYNDAILDGLDFLLAEMGKRDMKAVLYLNNSWEWSGGYSQYLEWAGAGKAPIPAIDGWNTFSAYVNQYARNPEAQRLFENYVHDMVTRTNRYTGQPYTDDPTIMSWQIGNEPRAFSSENKELFRQ